MALDVYLLLQSQRLLRARSIVDTNQMRQSNKPLIVLLVNL